VTLTLEGTVKAHRSWKPSPSMIVAMIALFAALAGTAWAAGLTKNSVGSKQIKPNAVKSVDVLDGGITSADLADGSVGSADMEASLATTTFTVHRSFPADGNPNDLISVPGIAVLTGRCGAASASLGYTNASANQQVVTMIVNPATEGGAGSGQESTATVAPGKGSGLGVLQSTSVEGQVRVAASGQYVDADVLFAHPAADPNTCETWTKVTISPDLGAG
jgi:hypothetical protein